MNAYDDQPDLDDDIDPEGPSAEDLARFGGDTITCRNCGEEVWDDAAICPRCGRALHEELRRDETGGPPKWAVLTAVVMLVVFVLFFVL